jgi:hypothetical protein
MWGSGVGRKSLQVIIITLADLLYTSVLTN